jgi:hypothetical protein
MSHSQDHAQDISQDIAGALACGCIFCAAFLSRRGVAGGVFYVDRNGRASQAGARGVNPKDLRGVIKLPLRLIPPPALAYLARAMAVGARKYGPFNWRRTEVKLTVYLEAALRHILAKADGENDDPESGLPHEAHAMACMAIILDAIAMGKLIDDRYPPGAFGQLVQALQDGAAP